MDRDMRELLKPWDKQRIDVRGVLDDFGDWTRNLKANARAIRRESLRACIQDPEVDGRVVGQHVWVVDCKHWEQYRELLGTQVSFSAIVSEYTARGGHKDYCLTNASELVALAKPPALLIPNEREILAVKRELVADKLIVSSQTTTTVAVDPTAPMKRARKLVRTCGGKVERALDVLQFMRENPGIDPDELAVWVQALSYDD